MKAQWLIETDIFNDTESDLIQVIKDSGRIVKTTKYIPFDDNLVDRLNVQYDPNDCVIFYGSLNYGRKMLKTPYIPGVYLDSKKYECTSYYPVFGKELLHSNYMMMPYGDLLRRKEYIYENFGPNIFIRPNSGMKEFTGMVLTYDMFEEGVKLAGFYNNEPDLLVIVSGAKSLKKEWRFVIVNQEVISGSLYRDWTIGPDTIQPGTVTRDYVLMNSKSTKLGCEDIHAWEYAKKLAKLYNPESAWTMDVCQVEHIVSEFDDYRLIEIGCFSCAGLYGNDLNKVVEAVSLAAENDWKEYNMI